MKRFFLVFLCVILIIPSVFADAIPNKICPACGWKLNPEWPIDFARAKFCGHCGTVLAEAPDETPAPTAAPAIQAKIGDIITFGHYEQDGNLSNGKEEIEWIVLDQKDDQIFVISKHSLDCQPFHTSMVYVTWKTCSLRQWLNNDFFNAAFSIEEQSCIPTVTVTADKGYGNNNSSNVTNDKVYLLSRTEAGGYFLSDDARKCEFTAYAAQQKQKKATWGLTGTWWLRTPGASDGSNVAHFIDDDGIAFYSNGATSNTDVDANLGVRPAIWISLSDMARAVITTPAPTATPPATPVPINQAKVGDLIVLGHYEQDNNPNNGKEEIEWLVLDVQDGKALVISKYGLICKPYNTTNFDVTWKTSSLRSWLNQDFFNFVFNNTEKARINKATVLADKNTIHFTIDPGDATQDNLFLLSHKEAKKYFTTLEDRRCEATAYAKSKGVETNDSGLCEWWLRTPGHSRSFAVYVRYGGGISAGGNDCNNESYAIRPAMWIDLTP